MRMKNIVDKKLAFDIGAFNGDDTAHYLEAGYRVVAVEANPTLAEQLLNRFREEVASGTCVILNVGVSDREGPAPFYICERLPIWSSFDEASASRDGMEVRKVWVDCITFARLLEQFGVPYFLKTDIEGADRHCILSLGSDTRPHYVSFEAESDAVELVWHLASVGYRRFRLVNQRGWDPVVVPSPGGVRHVTWATRQLFRLTLRRFGLLHSLLKNVRNWLYLKSPTEAIPIPGNPAPSTGTTALPKGSSGPIPCSQALGWLDLPEFLHTWVSVQRAGILESAWFDIHAELTTSEVKSPSS